MGNPVEHWRGPAAWFAEIETGLWCAPLHPVNRLTLTLSGQGDCSQCLLANDDEGARKPVVLRVKGYKFWFYEADLDEPLHVHVGREYREAKFWLKPVRKSRAGGFWAIELRDIERIIDNHLDFLLNAWAMEQSKRDRS